MKGSIFWNPMSFRPLKLNWRFGGAHRLHLQGRITQTKKQHEGGDLKTDATYLSETSVDFQRVT